MHVNLTYMNSNQLFAAGFIALSTALTRSNESSWYAACQQWCLSGRDVGLAGTHSNEVKMSCDLRRFSSCTISVFEHCLRGLMLQRCNYNLTASLLWLKFDRLAVDTMSLILGVTKSLHSTHLDTFQSKAHLHIATYINPITNATRLHGLFDQAMCKQLASKAPPTACLCNTS